MRWTRRALALGLVIGVVGCLALAIGPMLFFSGSQLRAVRRESGFEAARNLALSGLRMASERLRVERWYGDLSVLGEMRAVDAGLDPARGDFRVVCEDTVVDAHDIGPYSVIPLVHHIDVFAGAEVDGVRVGAYGAFIMDPEPELKGRSTEGYSSDGRPPDTMKRLVRVRVFPDPGFSRVEDPAVRDAIRARVEEESAVFPARYAEVDWEPAGPAPEPPAHMDEAAADAFLAGFVRRARLPGEDPEAVFLRDRLRDMLFEGTPVARRAAAARQRTVRIPDPAQNGLRLEAELVCTKVPSCQWGPFPPQTELLLPPPTGADPRTAVQKLHALREGTPDAGYAERVAQHPCARLVYEWGTWEAEPGTIPEPTLVGMYPGRPYLLVGGAWWVDFFAAKSLDPCVPADFQLEDPASGRSQPVRNVFDFFRKYFGLHDSVPLGNQGIDKTTESGMGYVPSGTVIPPNALLRGHRMPPGTGRAQKEIDKLAAL